MNCPTCGKDARPYFAGIMELCPHCSFLFVTNDERARQQKAFIDTEVYSEKTVDALAQKYPRDAHAKRDLYTRTASLLIALLAKPASDIRAIDLGANGGFFLNALEKAGVHKDNLVAAEMSPNYIELTNRYFGYTTLRGNIENLSVESPFDLVTMFDVLEHIDNVSIALTHIHSLLTQNGILFLKLPNGAWARYKTFFSRLFGHTTHVKKQLYLEPGGHLNYWTPRNINHLEQYGFSLLETGFVRPTKTQFKTKFPFYILWYRLNTLFGLNAYPEFYAIFRKK